MSFYLTKLQRQGLGNALRVAGYDPKTQFVYTEEPDDDEDAGSVKLTNRDTFDSFTITEDQDIYYVTGSVPGTDESQTNDYEFWGEVEGALQNWAAAVKKESEAVDPWEKEAEDMANDDSYFRQDELPKVDEAIVASLDELKRLAIEHGKTAKQIAGDLSEIKQILQKTARSSTKKEWLSIFKGIIVEKLIDWGIQAQLFTVILQVLITSAHEIAQLAEHASRYLLN